MASVASAAWVRSDGSGTDEATLARHAGGWLLAGRARFADAGGPAALRYRVWCDGAFRSRRAEVRGHVAGRRIARTLVRARDGWRVGGRPRADLAGCVDVDLAFTPATNLLPIRRLRLAEGAAADVPAAWLRFPELDVRRLDQRYTRRSEGTYTYRSPGYGRPGRGPRRLRGPLRDAVARRARL